MREESVEFFNNNIFVSYSACYLDQSPEKGTDKARLLARMSKMGKNPLSLPGAVVAEPENDDMGEPEQVDLY